MLISLNKYKELQAVKGLKQGESVAQVACEELELRTGKKVVSTINVKQCRVQIQIRREERKIMSQLHRYFVYYRNKFISLKQRI